MSPSSSSLYHRGSSGGGRGVRGQDRGASSLGTRSYRRNPTTPRAEMRTTVHFDIHYPKKRVDDEDLSIKMQLL